MKLKACMFKKITCVLMLLACAGNSFAQGDSIWKKILKEQKFIVMKDTTKIPNSILNRIGFDTIGQALSPSDGFVKTSCFPTTKKLNWAANNSQYWIVSLSIFQGKKPYTCYYLISNNNENVIPRTQYDKYEFEKFKTEYLKDKIYRVKF